MLHYVSHLSIYGGKGVFIIFYEAYYSSIPLERRNLDCVQQYEKNDKSYKLLRKPFALNVIVYVNYAL